MQQVYNATACMKYIEKLPSMPADEAGLTLERLIPHFENNTELRHFAQDHIAAIMDIAVKVDQASSDFEKRLAGLEQDESIEGSVFRAVVESLQDKDGAKRTPRPSLVKEVRRVLAVA